MFKISEAVRFLKDSGYECEAKFKQNIEVSGFCSLYELKDGSITWARNVSSIDWEEISRYKNLVLVAAELPESLPESLSVICCKNPKAAFFSIVEKYFAKKKSAIISEYAAIRTKKIGKNVSIGDFSSICEDVIIEDDVVIEHNVSITCPTRIGKGSTIASGTVIGTDGYGYYKDAKGVNQRVPHLGGVVIGDYVEIGANVCIDRGTIGNTVIEDYVKIDNLCHVAHNVHIEKHAMVIALSMLAGSSHIGEQVYIAPGALVMDQKTVGRNSLIGMGSVVTKDVPEGKVVVGVPAKVIRDNE